MVTCISTDRYVPFNMSLLTFNFWVVTLDSYTLDISFMTWYPWPVTLNMSLLTSHSWHVNLDMQLLTCNYWLGTLDLSILTFHSWLVILSLSLLSCHSWLFTLDLSLQYRRGPYVPLQNFLIRQIVSYSPDKSGK